MTNHQLFDAIGMLSEDLIADADAPVQKTARTLPWRQIGALAACLCIAVGCFVVPMIARQSDAAAKKEQPTEPLTTAASDAAPDAVSTEDVTHPDLEPEDIVTTNASPQPEATTTVRPPMTTTTVATTTAATTTVATSGSADDPTVPSEVLVFAQSFDACADSTDSEALLAQLGLSADVYDAPITAATEGGRLRIAHSGDGDAIYRLSATDDAAMAALMNGYVLEYELEYVAADADAYVTLVTEYAADGQCYRQFSFRADGTAQHGAYVRGQWQPYTAQESVPATALLDKLSGLDSAAAQPLCGTRVCVRLCADDARGIRAYLKTAAMAEYVLISETLPAAEGTHVDGSAGRAIALKVHGNVSAWMDDIRVYG